MKVNEEEKIFLHWLTHMVFLGAVKIQEMRRYAGSYQAIYNIEERHFRKNRILTERETEQLGSWKKQLERTVKEYYSLPTKGIQFITSMEDQFPSRLREIYGSPVALYVKGKLPEEELPTAAIIGARACSLWGRQSAEYLGEVLGQAGIQVISGLASGIDGAGHRGALRCGGETFGVLGCGVDICYPREHTSLYARMTVCGGIISEYGPGEIPRPVNFPMRNRIISGLSDLIIVVEAKEKSGSLITVELGLEQGKEIYALPGRMTDELSQGCNQLIRDGAGIVTCPGDLLEHFGIKDENFAREKKKVGKGLAKNEKIVYSCLDLQPKFIEQIAAESGVSIPECISVLLDLKLGGSVMEPAKQYYTRKL